MGARDRVVKEQGIQQIARDRVVKEQGIQQIELRAENTRDRVVKEQGNR